MVDAASGHHAVNVQCGWLHMAGAQDGLCASLERQLDDVVAAGQQGLLVAAALLTLHWQLQLLEGLGRSVMAGNRLCEGEHAPARARPKTQIGAAPWPAGVQSLAGQLF